MIIEIKRCLAIVWLANLVVSSLGQSSGQSTCASETCKKESEKMLSRMDNSIGACDDFYSFACGNYKPEISNDKVKIDELGLILDTLQERLNVIMSAEPNSKDIDPIRRLKVLYQNCMDKEQIEKLGLVPIKEIIDGLGGWPATHEFWNESSWTWQKTALDIEMMGMPTNYLFEISLGADQKNTTKRILGIDQPLLGLNREYMIKGQDDSLVAAYHSLQIDIAVLFGSNKSTAEIDMKDALDFEIALAKLSLAREDRRNSTALYNPLSLKSFKEKFPDMDWVKYFNSFLLDEDQITENEIIIMSNETLFVTLSELLDATPKRTVANYMMWRSVLSVALHLNEKVRNRYLEYLKIQSGKKEFAPRWKKCVAVASKYLPIATGSLYVRKYFNEESKEVANEMVDAIKNEFKETLTTVPWMDEKTRGAALTKIEKMEKHVGYPNELMDDEKLIKLYENLDIPPNEYLKSVLNLIKFRVRSEMEKFRLPINKTDWETHADVAIANAYYSWLENGMLIPAGILQGAFFDIERPRYMNYAAIGLVIGHEISHGFDDQGRQFDFDGNLVEWWEQDTKQAYLEKARCIIEQYGNFTEPTVGLKLNGINTQGENIADNGGVITAYRAYQKWVEANGAEQILPGLSYNSKQLFWLSLAQTWCSVFREEELKLRITTGVHSLPRFRITGPLQNIQEFSDDFGCPSNSRMNPSRKCKVW